MGYVLLTVLVIVLIAVCIGLQSKSMSGSKGSFTVNGYKNGELVYKKIYVNESFTISPGDQFDRVEILE